MLAKPAPPRPTGPAVIIVKVCRTPSSGAFDEMPKTGTGRAAAKAADAALESGDASGFHTRIVRGEARLFRFLQIVARREARSNAKTGITRLLADLPVTTNPEDGSTIVDESGINMEEQTGPVPRLLIFERLVDLDAILTPKGWVKRRRQWSHLEVEEVARDVALGLSFLHANFSGYTDHVEVKSTPCFSADAACWPLFNPVAVVHGDLKPSNIMRDAKTGAAKLIDLGASRRFVCVPNLYKESTTAVEEFDQFLADGSVPPQNASMVHTEGLGSLTGSPYFMVSSRQAPNASGTESHPSLLPFTRPPRYCFKPGATSTRTTSPAASCTTTFTADIFCLSALMGPSSILPLAISSADGASRATFGAGHAQREYISAPSRIRDDGIES